MHGLRKRLTPFISTESIDFQSDAFFKELVLIVNEIRELKNDKMADSDQVGSLGRVIQHHTGLNVAVDLGGTEPAMQIPMLDKNHPLVNSFIRNHLSSAIGQKKIARVVAELTPAKGKVSWAV